MFTLNGLLRTVHTPFSECACYVKSLTGYFSYLCTKDQKMKERLFGKTLAELKLVSARLGLPGFTARQMADWLYKKDMTSIDEMSNLSKKARELLKEHFELGKIAPAGVEKSRDGTKKYLFPTIHGNYIETAMIPDKKRTTVCVSSQAGCRMNCLFCMTGRQGFQGQLTAGEMLNQLKSIEESEAVSNVVCMGMGEPFDNTEEVLKSIEILTADWGFAMSPRRITVSTIGVIPGMRAFLEKSEAHLAVSLHTPFHEERLQLMPLEKAYPLEEVVKEIKRWDFSRQRRVSFEYILFEGLNDTPLHVKGLVRLLRGLKCRINLIRFHQIPETTLKSPGEERILSFKEQLNQKGILTTIRASRGQDIYAACGLLSTMGKGSD